MKKKTDKWQLPGWAQKDMFVSMCETRDEFETVMRVLGDGRLTHIIVAHYLQREGRDAVLRDENKTAVLLESCGMPREKIKAHAKADKRRMLESQRTFMQAVKRFGTDWMKKLYIKP